MNRTSYATTKVYSPARHRRNLLVILMTLILISVGIVSCLMSVAAAI